MKRAGNLIPEIAQPDNLRLAFWKAAKGKDGNPEVEGYRKRLDWNLEILRNQILAGKVEVGHYHYFKIFDPKERMICAASFPERVLHHALMNICHPVFEDFQMDDSFATRKGKGTYAALHHAKTFHARYPWYLKLDIRKYFDSIDQNILLDLLRRRFKDKKLLGIFEQLLNSYQTADKKGLPIGNLTSQYFANFYLGFMDRFTKQALRLPAYVRYMDDMILWHDDKALLLLARAQVEQYLKGHLGLNLKVAQLNRTSQGLTFIGYRIFPGYTWLSPRSKKRLKIKMRLYHHRLLSGEWTQSEFQRHILPLLSFAKSHASTLGLRRNILKDTGQ
jgi:hypothetical protein